MRPDQTPEGGKFRATAAAALDGTTGAWGDADMLCVALDASGQLIAANNDDVIGVIWTPEGRKTASDDSHKDVIGDRKYTVFTRAEFVEVDTAASPALTAGDLIYATASGDVLDTGMTTGDVFVGMVVADANDAGGRLIVDIDLLPPAV